MPAPAFRPDRIGEGYKPASYYKRSNILRRFCHQKKRKEVDPHYQQYYQGRLLTDVTEVLKPSLPGSPFKDPVFFPHHCTDVTEIYENAGKLTKRPATAPDVSHGVKNSDVTETNRIIPPGHLGKDPHKIRLPYFGIRTSSVTDPSRYIDTSGLPLLSWWENRPNSRMPARPQTAPAVVYPQHMNPVLLQKHILERRPYRRSEFVAEKRRLYSASKPPSLAASTPRSDHQAGKNSNGELLTSRSQLNSARSNMSSMTEKTSSARSDKPPASARSSAKSQASSVAQHSTKSQMSGTGTNKSDKTKASGSCGLKDLEVGSSKRSEGARSNPPVAPAATANSEKTPPSKPPSSRATKSSSSGKPPKPPPPSSSSLVNPRNSLPGFPSLTAEALEKLGPEKMDRVTKWAGELQTWAIPDHRSRPPKPVYYERDHGRKKTDVTDNYVW